MRERRTCVAPFVDEYLEIGKPFFAGFSGACSPSLSDKDELVVVKLRDRAHMAR